MPTILQTSPRGAPSCHGGLPRVLDFACSNSFSYAPYIVPHVYPIRNLFSVPLDSLSLQNPFLLLPAQTIPDAKERMASCLRSTFSLLLACTSSALNARYLLSRSKIVGCRTPMSFLVLLCKPERRVASFFYSIRISNWTVPPLLPYALTFYSKSPTDGHEDPVPTPL